MNSDAIAFGILEISEEPAAADNFGLSENHFSASLLGTPKHRLEIVATV